MLICANYQIGLADFNFILPKDAYLKFRQLQKRVWTGNAKNEILGPTVFT